MQYALFQTTSYGFVKQTFNAIVDGITKVCFLYHHQLLQTPELAKAQMKFYKTKKFFFCVFTYLIFYKKVLKYVSVKKMYSFQWKFENIFCC